LQAPSDRSGQLPICWREQLVAVAVFKGNRFVKLVAHHETLRGMRLKKSDNICRLMLHLRKFIAALRDAAEGVNIKARGASHRRKALAAHDEPSILLQHSTRC
jgi:hypothetical protein